MSTMKTQIHYKVPVLYEDNSILVVSKPTGLVSVPDGYDMDAQNLVSVLEPKFGELWVVHRLECRDARRNHHDRWEHRVALLRAER